MQHFGMVKPGTKLYVEFDSFGADGESITLTGLAAADIEIYKDGGTTQRASDSGYALLDTDGIDFDSLTGIHGISIDLADNTAAGFWAAGSHYRVVISSVTINSQTVRFTAATFEIGYPSAIHNTTIATLASQTSFTLTEGPAEDDALNGLTLLAHDVASKVQMGRGIISDYTGSTKTVTLASANVTFTMAATDNVSLIGVQPLVPTTAGDSITTSGGIVSADIIKVSGDTTAADNLELQYDGTGLTGNTFPAAQLALATVDANVDAILVDTAVIGAAGAGLTDLGGMSTTMKGQVNTEADTALADYDGPTNTEMLSSFSTTDGLITTVDTVVDAVLADTGTTLPATLATIDGIVDSILVDTNELQADWANGGRLDLIQDAILVDTATTIPGTISTIDTVVDAVLVDTGTTIPATITAIDTVVDAILVDTGTTIPATITAIDTVVDAVLVDTGTTIPATITAIDTVVDAILVDTGTTIPATITTIDTVVDAVLVDTGTTIPATLGTPAVDVSADIAAVKVDTAAVLVDTGTTLDTKINTIDTVVDAILVDTGTTLDTKINTLDTNVDSVLADTGTTLPATLATIDGIVDSILVDTNELQADWANGGRLDLIQDIIATDTTTDIPALIENLNDPAAAVIADAVWDELQTAHVTTGSFGLYLDESVGGIAAGSGVTAAQVWAYATRNLTMTVQEISAAVSGTTVSVMRGDTMSVTLANLGDISARSKIWFTVKRGKQDIDTRSVLQIDSTGLIILNGATGTLANGSITVDDATAGDITLALNPAEAALLPPGSYPLDVQMLTTGGVVTTLAEGRFTVLEDVTKATS